MSAPLREVRALHDEATVRVYQAYSPAIADAALGAQRFVPPFKRDRMTWIKPSFHWMMYRSGWATKPGQERVLAIDVTRRGFEWALAHATLSHFEPALHSTKEEWEASVRATPVRVQWDPERSPSLEPLPWRAIQIGLSGEAVHAYVDEWTRRIEDVTALATDVAGAVRAKDLEGARRLAPVEAPYPVPPEIASRLLIAP